MADNDVIAMESTIEYQPVQTEKQSPIGMEREMHGDYLFEAQPRRVTIIPSYPRWWRLRIVFGSVSLVFGVIVITLAAALYAKYPGYWNEPMEFEFPVALVREILFFRLSHSSLPFYASRSNLSLSLIALL